MIKPKELYTVINDMGRKLFEGGVRDTLEKNMECGVTLIECQYYEKHHVALCQTEIPVLDRIYIIEREFNKVFEEIDLKIKFMMISSTKFLLHMYMLSEEMMRTFEAFENMGYGVKLSPLLGEALHDAEVWDRNNEIPLPDFGEDIPDEVFKNDIFQPNETGNSLIDEFCRFADFEDD